MKKIVLLFLFCFSLILNAQIHLPKLISDNMILQRDKPVKIWGWASPGEKIELKFNKKSFNAVEKKFESGLVDVTDYSAAKTTLFNAETEALRTKLQLLIRKLTIQFYSTGEYEKVINQ